MSNGAHGFHIYMVPVGRTGRNSSPSQVLLSMKLLTTVTTITLSAALAVAAAVGAPIEARQSCSVALYTEAGFAGTPQTFNGDSCVSNYHLSTALCFRSGPNININVFFP